MNEIVSSILSWFSFAPNVIAALVIGMCGEIAKKLILSSEMPKGGYRGFKGVYYVTYKSHALFVGAALGWLGYVAGGLPLPESFKTDGPGGSILNYAGTGLYAMVGYPILVGQLKNLLHNRRVIRESMRPPAMD